MECQIIGHLAICNPKYHSSLAALTQIILLLEMLKFSKIIFVKEHFFEKENEKYFIFEMQPSKLNDYLANVC